MLRGRLNIVVSPVSVSMLAKITVSVRVPVRLGPASPPSSRMFSRGLSAHGFCGFGWPRVGLLVAARVGRVALLDVLSLLKTVPTRLA